MYSGSLREKFSGYIVPAPWPMAARR